jgi:uncharacterized repeat protein (TIGR03943 family)
VNREAQSVVLFLLGGAILRISATDVYLRYVKEGLRPFLLASGALLVAIAGVTLYREVFSRSAEADESAAAALHDGPAHAREDGHVAAHGAAGAHAPAHARAAEVEAGPHAPTEEHEAAHHAPAEGHEAAHHAAAPGHHAAHGHGGPRVAWLLVLPVFAVFLIGPPALGSYAAGRGGTSVAKQSEYAPLPAGDPVPLAVLDYASRAVWDRGASLTDRRVRVTGFVSPRPGGGVYLTRMILTCCAADGRPVKVGLSGEVPGGLTADMWIEVTGRYDPRTDKDTTNAETIPYLEVESMRTVPQPKQPYEQ